MTEKKIIWRIRIEVYPIYEAYTSEGQMVGWITNRPHYCDRGHWQAQVEVENLDGADGFPRYFMRLSTALDEMTRFLHWRLYKERDWEDVISVPDLIKQYEMELLHDDTANS